MGSYKDSVKVMRAHVLKVSELCENSKQTHIKKQPLTVGSSGPNCDGKKTC